MKIRGGHGRRDYFLSELRRCGGGSQRGRHRGLHECDYEDDQEKDPDMSSLNIVTRISTSSVVAYSVNYGKVEVKNDNGGGIVGLQELGLVYGCESYGNISSDSGTNGRYRETAWQLFRIPMSEARWRALIIWAVLPAAEPR